MNQVLLKAGRERALVHHHPWLFSGAIQCVQGAPTPGETVAVCDAKGTCLGYGSYSPTSQIRVRLLSFDAHTPVSPELIEQLVAQSIARRSMFFQSHAVTGFRLIHAENDGLPGVTADYYDGFVVVQLASCGAVFWKETLVKALFKYVPNCRGVFNRSDVDARVQEGLPPDETGLLAGDEPPELILIREGTLSYYVDVRAGHKTGFYLDQRDARAEVGASCEGKDVLNCFSYTGGFGLAACAHGARSVTHVDVSHEALALAEKNTALLSAHETSVSFVEADVFKQLRLYRDAGQKFDVIVLDPPKFAHSKASLMRAARGYKDINLLAMKLLRPNGMLATFSCSGAMSCDLFEKICAEAACDAQVPFQIVARTFQARGDHPVALNFPEGLYLKGLILRA